MGKSLYVKRLGEKLEQKRLGSADCNVVTIPLHGPVVDNDILMKLLEGHMNRNSISIYHVDVAPSVCSLDSRMSVKGGGGHQLFGSN